MLNTNPLDEYPELDLHMYTTEADDDLFVTPLDENAEPTEIELKAKEMAEKYLPEKSFSIFKCPICKERHDMFKLKSSNGSLICSTTGRVI